MSETTQRSNLEAIRRGYAAFASADIDTMQRLIASDARYRHTPVGKFSGDYRGQAAILDFFSELGRESNGTLRVSPVEMAASGNSVFVRCHTTGRRNGALLDSENVAVFTLTEGVITEAIFFYRDWPAEAAFWS
jgi:ketosteroid isomerase-like protein